MKALQDNFTTPEQEKRLLELGVPKWTADCYHEVFPKGVQVKPSPFFVPSDPCWSVCRLMEIAHICSDSTLSYKEEANEIQKIKEENKCETLIEAVIVCITDAVSIGSINFSKLED